jgi:hypothetical protein
LLVDRYLAIRPCSTRIDEQRTQIVSEDDATPLAYLKIGDSALQPLLYSCCIKGTLKVPQAAYIIA